MPGDNAVLAPHIKKEVEPNTFQACSPSNSDMYSPTTTVLPQEASFIFTLNDDFKIVLGNENACPRCPLSLQSVGAARCASKLLFSCSDRAIAPTVVSYYRTCPFEWN